METINLAEKDGLPAEDWAGVLDKLHTGSAPNDAAYNARTTWLSTVNETDATVSYTVTAVMFQARWSS